MSPATSVITAILAIGIIYNGVQMIRHKAEIITICLVGVKTTDWREAAEISRNGPNALRHEETIKGQLTWSITCEGREK